MNNEIFKKQLDSIIQKFDEMGKKSQHNDLSDLPKADRQSLITRGIASVNRISGANSIYSLEIQRIIEKQPHLHLHTSSVIGVVKALKEDLELGYLQGLAEIVHSEVFSDFLEMAKYLNENGYKDASAVIAGSTLESHLRKIADKHSVSIENNGKPIKANKLNADLTKIGAYELLDQKNITAWLDLRNNAAHGKYEEYESEQVKLLISGVQDFITRIRA
jgi:hypothetical protein